MTDGMTGLRRFFRKISHANKHRGAHTKASYRSNILGSLSVGR